jgi:hypothetical protein
VSKKKMTFTPSRAGIRALSSSAGTKHALGKISDKIARQAQKNGSIFTKGYDSHVKMKGGKYVGRAGTDHSVAHWDEWGNATRTPRAPMRKALHDLGLWSRTKVLPK